MSQTGLPQKLLDATMPGRDNLHIIFSENAPEHVLQHIVDRIKARPSTQERTFLNEIVNAHQFSFHLHAANPDLMERDLALLDAVTFASDLTQYCYRISIYAAGQIMFFLNVTDRLIRDGIPTTKDNVRSFMMTRILQFTTGIGYSNPDHTFEFIRDNLTAFNDYFSDIIYKPLGMSEIEELVKTHSSLRGGVL